MRGGGGRKRPPAQVFLVPLLNAARFRAHTYWIFLNIHCAHSGKKAESGQVRSPERVCWAHPPQNVCNHAWARVFFYGLISSLQVCNRVPVCAFVHLNFVYICDLRSCQIRGLWKYMKSVLLRVNESKPPNYFRIMTCYLICNGPGAFTDRGTGKGHLRSYEVINM